MIKKSCLILLAIFVCLLTGCSKSFEFDDYTSLVVNKDYILSEYPTFTTVKLTNEEKDEIFHLVNELKIREENDLVLDINGYIYQIIIDGKEINFVNAEFLYYENTLYEVTSGNNELILYLTNLQ